jgi:hypothetical protein
MYGVVDLAKSLSRKAYGLRLDLRNRLSKCQATLFIFPKIVGVLPDEFSGA